MSQWPSAKAGRVLAAPMRIGWTLSRTGWADFVFASALARIARRTGLRSEDL